MGTTAKAVSFDGESLNFTQLGQKPAHTPSGPYQEVGCTDPRIQTASADRGRGPGVPKPAPRRWSLVSFLESYPAQAQDFVTPASSGAGGGVGGV